jgi:hypothetical protein
MREFTNQYQLRKIEKRRFVGVDIGCGSGIMRFEWDFAGFCEGQEMGVVGKEYVN